jgi:hypothetical protein
MDEIELLEKIRILEEEKLKRLGELKLKIEILRKFNESAKKNFYATAVIVEPRKHKALSFVVKNVLENLSEEWNVIIYHIDFNEHFVKELLKNELNEFSSRIILENLGVDNLTFQDYNRLILDTNFISKIPTETYLIFQTDSIINSRYKDLIYTFLKYDYVGAPWRNGEVGNGGFSLRKKSKSLEVTKRFNIPKDIDIHEDMYYSDGGNNLYKPPFELACLFSIETVYSKVFFGVHGPWKHHDEKTVKEMCENCPGLSELISLQGVFE